MKAVKFIVLSLIVAILTVGFTACTNFQKEVYTPTEEAYFTFTQLEDGTYSVAAKDVANLPEVVALPKTYEGKDVTVVAENAFKGAQVKDVRIPATYKVIGKNAFYGCASITSLYFYKGVVTIEDGAFYGLSALKQVDLPGSLQTIGASAFAGCEKLSNLTITEKVTEVGEYAFAYCTSLNKVYIPRSVASLAETAFNGCESTQFEISAGNEAYKLDENGKPVAR